MFTTKSKVLALLLAAAMMCMLAACSTGTATPTTAPSTTEAAATTEATKAAPAATERGEPVTITGASNIVATTWSDYPDNPLAQYILENLNIVIESIDWSESKDAMMASGDLPDFFIIEDSERQPLIDSGFIIKLDELLDRYGLDIKNNIPLGLEFSRGYWSDGSGALYCLTGGNDYEPIGYGAQPQDFGLNLNWSLYEQLGYPEITTDWDGILDVVKQMVALQPTTADGLPVYGIPAFTEWGMWGQVLFSVTPMGYLNQSYWSVVLDEKTLQIVDNYTDPESPLWKYAEFLYKENQAGIFDKDSLICSWSDLCTKATNGQYVGGMWKAMFSSANQLLAGESKGYTLIPVTNGSVWGGADYRYGQKNARCISSTADRPDVVMQFLNFSYSLDGARIMNSGIEGVHWEYVDGVPTVKDDLRDLYSENGVGWKQTGIGAITNFNLVTFEGSDGYPINLFYSKDFGKVSMTDFDKKVAEHYGTDTLLTHFEGLVEKGTMVSQSAVDTRISNMMPAISDDLSRIANEADGAMLTGLAKCILAADDSEFAANKEALIQQVKDLGIEQVVDWYKINYEKIRSELPAKAE